jgi:D-alanyl-D-alanine carboxypeptidase
MNAFKIAAAIVALLLAASAGANANPLSQSQIRRIGAIAAKALSSQHISGLEIGIGRGGSVLFARGYGLRDRAKHLPVTAQTVFPIGSITKQFTAACVMQLVARGKVRLDARVSQYLRSAPHASQITVRELLDQTSGLADYLEDKPLLTSIMSGTVGPRSIASMVALVDGKPLHFKPGTKYEYSNTNYALAGLIVAKVSGTPYGQYLQRNIFRPQHLTRTQYLSYSVPSGNDVTRGYDFRKGAFVQLPRFSMDWGNAAGSIASDVSDLIRWDNGFFSGSVIPLNLVRVATTPPPGIAMLRSKNSVNDIGMGYAFGWVQARAEGRQLVWHNGGLPGARAMNAVFPQDGLDIVVLTNASDAQPENIALQIARIIYDTP